MKRLLMVGAMLPMLTQAGTLYLCRAYNGGNFWSQSHCNQHNALIESLVSVPEDLPFDQQVKLGEQKRQPKTATNIYTNRVINDSTGANKASECTALNSAIAQFDSMARQPQSAQMQDWIAEEKKKTRDRQFRLGC